MERDGRPTDASRGSIRSQRSDTGRLVVTHREGQLLRTFEGTGRAPRESLRRLVLDRFEVRGHLREVRPVLEVRDGGLTHRNGARVPDAALDRPPDDRNGDERGRVETGR